MFLILYTIRNYREEARGKNLLQTKQKKGKNSSNILLAHRISQFKPISNNQLITYLKL